MRKQNVMTVVKSPEKEVVLYHILFLSSRMNFHDHVMLLFLCCMCNHIECIDVLNIITVVKDKIYFIVPLGKPFSGSASQSINL